MYRIYSRLLIVGMLYKMKFGISIKLLYQIRFKRIIIDNYNNIKVLEASVRTRFE
jgi:hypothetical protein